MGTAAPENEESEGMDLGQFDNSDFDRGASVAKEAAWRIVQGIFFHHCPMRFYGMRRRLLRMFGARVGKGVVVKPNVSITFPWKLTIGEHSWLGEDAWLLNLAPVSIGSHVCISQRAFLCTGNHDWSDRRFRLMALPIVVEDRVWVCAQVFVGPGVTIGADAVVTAGSVVTHDLPGGMICSGNPCEPVKPRPTTRS